MVRAEGKQTEADYLFNCGYFEYFYRVLSYNRYVERLKEANKTNGKG